MTDPTAHAPDPAFDDATDLGSHHERFTDAGFSCALDWLRRALRVAAEPLALTGDVPGAALTAPPHDGVLLALTDDGADAVSLFVVEAERLDDTLRDDLAALHGKVFAGAGDLNRPLWDSALRVMAAIEHSVLDVGELARWGRDEGSALTEADLAPYWGRFTGCYVSRWDQLERPPAFVCAIRIAQ